MKQHPLILVVDDRLAGRKALELLLKEDGYRLAIASNGDEALRLASKSGASVAPVLFRRSSECYVRRILSTGIDLLINII